MEQIRTKTFIRMGFFAIALLFFAVVGVWLKTVSTNSGNLQHMALEEDQRQIIFTMRDASYQRAISLFRMAAMRDPFERDEEFLRYKQYAVEFIIARGKLLQHNLDQAELAIWEKTKPLIVRGQQFQNQIVELILEEQNERAFHLIQNELMPIQIAVMNELTSMLDHARGEMDSEIRLASATTQAHYILIFVLVFIALITGWVIAKYVIAKTAAAENVLIDQNKQIRALYEASSQSGHSVDEQIQNIVKLGCEFLDMQAGVIVRFNKDQPNGKILNSYSDDDTLTVDELLSESQSEHRVDCDFNDILAVADNSLDNQLSQPCLFNGKAKAYIAIPLNVHRNTMGFLAFLSNETRHSDFSETNKEMVRLIGSWASFTLERQQAQQQLLEAKDAAELANRTKSAFLANMSHELRTPLHTIIGYSDILKEEVAENQHQHYLEDLSIIHSSGEHLLSLISNILDLTKIEVGKMELAMETYDIKSMLDEVEVSLKPLVDKNDNQLNLQVLNDLGSMYTDSTKLRQVLLNLLNNAAKFTHKGTITLTAWREPCPEDDWLYVEVKDSGIGMSKKQINNLFKVFSQASPNIAKNYGGSGLGLAIGKKICELLGGDIVVESEPDKGSTFTICLPYRMHQHQLDIQAIA